MCILYVNLDMMIGIKTKEGETPTISFRRSSRQELTALSFPTLLPAGLNTHTGLTCKVAS